MSGRLGTDPDVEKWAKQARKQGWNVQITNNNHIKWINPEGQTVYVSALTFRSSHSIHRLRKILQSHNLSV